MATEYLKKKSNLWLTAPKGTIPVNQSSATDWQMSVRQNNVFSITLKPNNVDFLNPINYFSIKQLPNFPHTAGITPLRT